MSQFRIMSLGGWRVLALIAMFVPAATALDAAVFERAALAQGVVRDIKVEGNRRVEPETVRSYLQFNVGDAYDGGKVDGSLKALYGTGLFSDVNIDRDGGTVIIRVVENPVVNQVAFEGNAEVESDTLRNEVQTKPRSVFTRARVQADVQRILDVYQRQGRFAASVEPKVIEIEQNRVNLVFEITEGGATKVKGITFTGNYAFSDSQLRDIISTTQSGWFDFLKGTSIYDPDRMSLDRELLRQYYLKNGYADATVVAARAELDSDGSGFFVNFAIEEGQRYNFGPISVENSLQGLEAKGLNAEILTEQGEIYNAADVDKTVEKLTLAAAEQGFAFARVRPRANPDVASRTISVVYAVDEGPRIYIERINVSGNERTKDYVIRREFRLAEGDAFNPMLVDRAKKRLQGLGFFKAVEVKRRPGSAEDRVVLDVELVEQSTGELSFGAGYSTSEGVIGDVSITERNLLGNGQFLRLKFAGSFERLQVDLSFTEPRFLDYNMSAGFDLFHKEIDQSEESGFSSKRTGGGVRLGFPLSENLWMQTGYGLDVSSIEIDTDGRNVNELVRTEIETFGDQTITSSANTTLTYDKRNHPKNPTSGYYLQVGGEFAGLGGDVQYGRLSAEARGYYPITEKITFVGRAIAGHIEGWGDDDVRLNDLYFRGGETIRGFDRGGFGPRDTVTGDSVGGKTYWATTAEVRFPFPFVPDEIGLGGAIFADAGSLFGANDLAKSLSGKNTNPNNTKAVDFLLEDDASVRSSVGGSILWNSPVGPLRMDFAKALTKEKYDEEQFFRFGASTKF